MIAAERRSRTKEILLREHSVRVGDLAREFDVSEETVRRDLSRLEQEGFAVKNYGGAILSDDLQHDAGRNPPLRQRQFEHSGEKEAIGAAAAALVEDGQIVILDAGSTTLCVARHLKPIGGLTIVTNGINIAEEASDSGSGDAGVFLLGGKLVKPSMSLVGPQAEAELHKYNAHYAFLGTSGISLRKGFTSSDMYEAEVKRAMIDAAQRVVIVADHSKFDRQALLSFCSLGKADMLVTSELADAATLKEIEREGVRLVVVPASFD